MESDQSVISVENGSIFNLGDVSGSKKLPDAIKKWLPSLKKPEYVGVPKNIWEDLGKSNSRRNGSPVELCCKLCNQKSGSLKEAVIHLKDKHKDRKPYKCEDCDQRFNLKQNLESHRLIHLVKFDNKKCISCPICCATFRRHIVFRRHILTRHFVDDDFKCVECSETFQTKSKLEIHKLLHLARFERRKLRKLKKIEKILEEKEKLKVIEEDAISIVPDEPTTESNNKEKLSIEPRPETDINKAVGQLNTSNHTLAETNAVLEKLTRLKSLTEKLKPDSRQCPIEPPDHNDFRSNQFQIPVEFSPFPPFHNFSHNGQTTLKKIKKVRKRTSRLVIPGPLMGPINENWKNFQFQSNQYVQPNYHHQIPQSPFLCQYCGRVFKKQKYLRFHLNSHAGYRPHMCNICGKSFGRASILIKHKNTVHNKNLMPKYTCGQCCKQFVRKDMFHRHQLSHSQYRPWSCPYCHLHFKTKQTCSKHIKIHQTNTDDVIDRTDGIIGPMTQLLNQPSYWNQGPIGNPEEVSYHVMSQTPRSSHNIHSTKNNSNDPFPSLDNLVFDQSNSNPPNDQIDKSSTEAEIFPRQSANSSDLELYAGDSPVLLTETIDPPQIPTVESIPEQITTQPDGPKNSSKISKKKKTKIKSKRKSKPVTKAPAVRVSKEILVSEGDIEELASIKEVERNETVSLSEKYLIECSKEKITGKRSRVSNQEINEVQRGGFVCKECNKSYSRSNDLKRHMDSHKDLRLWKCNFENCSKSFNLKSSLIKHERTHSLADDKYKCHICEKKLSSSSALKRHIRIHTDAKPFSCSKCQKGFRQHDKVTKHELICKKEAQSSLVLKFTPLGKELMQLYNTD